MRTTIFLLLLALASVSCAGKQQNSSGEETGKLTFDSITVHEKIKLLPNEPDSLPYATIDIHFVYPVTFGTKDDLQKLQSLFYEKVFGEEYADATSPQEVIKRYIENYASTYRKAETDRFKEDYAKYYDGGYFPYYTYGIIESVSNSIEFRNNSLLSISSCTNSEYGGSHYTNNFSYATIRLSIPAVLAETDIFVPDYKEPLAQIIRQKLLLYAKEEVYRGGNLSDSELRESFHDFYSIYSNNRFLMDDKGLHFLYDTGEIAPVFDGNFEVDIPYGEIAHLLKPNAFAQLFPDIDLQKERENFQLQEKENGITVVDMFLLLPDEWFPEGYTEKEREFLFEEWANEDDIKENKFSLPDDFFYQREQMEGKKTNLIPRYVYYRQLPVNRHLVTVFHEPHKDIEYELIAYWYKNGKLEKDEEFYAFVNDNLIFKKTDFFDLENVAKEIVEEYLEHFANFIEYTFYVSESGMITITARYQNFYDYPTEIFDPIEHYIKFERIGDKWTKKRIKTYKD